MRGNERNFCRTVDRTMPKPRLDGPLGPGKKRILIPNIANFWEPLGVLLEQMDRLDFIRAGLPVKLLVAERVEEILPKLLEAARSVSEPEKEMTSVAAERM